MSDKYTITLKWKTGRNIERVKFDFETKLGRKLTWDEFFNKVEIKIDTDKKEGDKND